MNSLEYAQKQGLERIEKAMESQFQSRMANNPVEAEEKIREAVSLARSAYDWLEDTPYDEIAHYLIHFLGKEVREKFPKGCNFKWNGSNYERWCPADLVHIRLGLSPGVIIHSMECSVCGRDPSECDHILWKIYTVFGGPNESGRCPVCAENTCDHSPDKKYQVMAGRIITKAELEEISLVTRPKQPDARIQSCDISGDTIKSMFGPDFRYGEDTAHCAKCLVACPGFLRFRGDPKIAELSGDGLQAR